MKPAPIPWPLTSVGRMAGLTALLALSACATPGGVPRLVHAPEAQPALVEVTGGRVRGVAADGGKAWLGLPYAHAPVGPLRWRAPQPASPWVGVRSATRLGGDCVQNLSPRSLLGRPGGLFVRGREDCLVLNVYAPSNAVAGQGWPVMVWLHGGGFSAGTAGNYDPSLLAQKQGMVVVTLNYRLGALGFLALSGLRAEHPVAGTGDYGLLDQQAALRWVRDNITAFGGAPRRVTLWGESAGGFSVCQQLAAPGAAGPFARTIIESGACTAPALNAPMQLAKAAGALTARDLGCADPAAAPACLRRLPAHRLAQAVSHRRGALGSNSSGPVVGGPTLPLPAAEAFQRGRFAHVPVLMGTNRNEGRLFAYLQQLTGRLWTVGGYRQLLRAEYGDRAPEVEARYPAALYGAPAAAWVALVTDEDFACPTAETARLLAPQVPVRLYLLDDTQAPSQLPHLPFFPRLGAYHASEIAYVLQRPWNLADPSRFDAGQRRLSRAMQDAWGRFARTGELDGSDQPDWPQPPFSRRLAPTTSEPEAVMVGRSCGSHAGTRRLSAASW